MLKAVFLDFYGTVVHEDGNIIQAIAQQIFDTGIASDTGETRRYWWHAFETDLLSSYGDNFKTQREIERQSLLKTAQHFQSKTDVESACRALFTHWRKPPLFPESCAFFQDCPVPIYIVSNIDRADILAALDFHKLAPAGVCTSEDAHSYKPRPELFTHAIRSAGIRADEIIHIGDSLSSDAAGAASAGIRSIWINRNNRAVPEGILSATDLQQALHILASLP